MGRRARYQLISSSSQIYQGNDKLIRLNHNTRGICDCPSHWRQSVRHATRDYDVSLAEPMRNSGYKLSFSGLSDYEAQSSAN